MRTGREKCIYEKKKILVRRLLPWALRQEFPLSGSGSFVKESVFREKLLIEVAWLSRVRKTWYHVNSKLLKFRRNTTNSFSKFVNCVAVFLRRRITVLKENKIHSTITGNLITLLLIVT